MSDFARLNIIVEGQAEETFVRDILQEYLANWAVYATARRVETGRKHGQTYRGGMTSYDKVKRDIQRWLSGDRSAYLTTMFDLYKLPRDFPGLKQASDIRDPYEKVRILETDLAGDIESRRFIPYIQLHEFEGLLFSDVHAIDAVLRTHYGHSQLTMLQEIRAQFRTPEEINDDENTAPSKRLTALYPAYDKVAFGPRIAQRIGLNILRQECPHFNEWLSRLETSLDLS